MDNKGQTEKKLIQKRAPSEHGIDEFVLDKTIFSNVFDKDIRRVYFYKKAERIACAIHLIAPAFGSSVALRERLERIALALLDASTLAPSAVRGSLTRELFTLTSILSVAEVGGILSPMNVEVIDHEVQAFLQDILAYEDPRLLLPEVPTLAALQRSSLEYRKGQTGQTYAGGVSMSRTPEQYVHPKSEESGERSKGHDKGHVSDIPTSSTRRDAILAVLRSRGQSYIRDISTVVRGVSEKTIQRELQAMVSEGMITKEGERRWTTYALATSAA